MGVLSEGIWWWSKEECEKIDGTNNLKKDLFKKRCEIAKKKKEKKGIGWNKWRRNNRTSKNKK